MFAHVIAANAGAWLPPDGRSLSILVLDEKDHLTAEVETEARPYAFSYQPHGLAGLVRKAMVRIGVAGEGSA